MFPVLKLFLIYRLEIGLQILPSIQFEEYKLEDYPISFLQIRCASMSLIVENVMTDKSGERIEWQVVFRMANGADDDQRSTAVEDG